MTRPDACMKELDQVHELNRLFLIYLRQEAKGGRDCLGLPKDAVTALANADTEIIDRTARFPRALFRVNIGELGARTVASSPSSVNMSARQALQLTVLLSVWNYSRQSSYLARAFFGLSLETVRRLRMLPLSDLPSLALGAGMLACSFSRADWIWPELLQHADDESRDQLALVALQPRIESTLMSRPRAN